MTAESGRNGNEGWKSPGGLPLWVGIAVAGLLAVIVILLGLLAVSVMERRWEAQRPVVVVHPLGPWEPNNAVWGQNYPRQYESYMRTRITDTKTKYGGSYPAPSRHRPARRILFAGYGSARTPKPGALLLCGG
jgi:nitrite reductase (cytochrome c-552)